MNAGDEPNRYSGPERRRDPKPHQGAHPFLWLVLAMIFVAAVIDSNTYFSGRRQAVGLRAGCVRSSTRSVAELNVDYDGYVAENSATNPSVKAQAARTRRDAMPVANGIDEEVGLRLLRWPVMRSIVANQHFSCDEAYPNPSFVQTP